MTVVDIPLKEEVLSEVRPRTGVPAVPRVELARPDKTWPIMDKAAYHGIVGEFSIEADRHTEADPVAIHMSLLVMLGCLINSGPHAYVGSSRHGTNLFAVITGATSKGGKGTSYAICRALVNMIRTTSCPDLGEAFVKQRIMGGFGSGESIVDAAQVSQEGHGDTRLLIFDPEFARTLRVAGRDGSTASQVIRDAWDGTTLQARSRGRTSVAEHHHISFLAHVTMEELKARLTDTETYGGFTNRFLFSLADRTRKCHPDGGNVPVELLAEYARRIGPIVKASQSIGHMRRSPEAEKIWDPIYREMHDDDPGGLLGAAVSRDKPQNLRLSLLYAVLDGAKQIEVEHVEAAWAVWQYCRASAAYIFGDAVGDKNADRLLEAIQGAGSAGLSLTEQSKVFYGKLAAKQLDALRVRLEDAGLIVTAEEQPGRGRPLVVSRAI